MAREAGTRKRSTESRLIFTVLGVTVWIVTGFVVGLVAGVVSEEPQLLVNHMAGRDTEVEWAVGRDPSAVEQSLTPIPRLEPGTSLAPVGAAPKATLLEEPPPPSKPVLQPETPSEGSVVAASKPAKKSAASSPAPAAAGAPRFLIQVGAYDSRDSAQEVAETLRGKGYAVQVLSTSDDGRFRVRVGPVAARERAEGLAKRLESVEGMSTWILRSQES